MFTDAAAETGVQEANSYHHYYHHRHGQDHDHRGRTSRASIGGLRATRLSPNQGAAWKKSNKICMYL